MSGHEYNGFYRVRRGILEHVESGKIGLLDFSIYIWLGLKADYKTGLAISSAQMIHQLAPRQFVRASSVRTIQRSLKHLERIGWIKTWKIRGNHGNYPILINKFSVYQSVADKNGKVVTEDLWTSVEKTTDWKHVVFEPVAEETNTLVGDDVAEMSLRCRRGVAEVSPSKEVRTKKPKNKKGRLDGWRSEFQKQIQEKAADKGITLQVPLPEHVFEFVESYGDLELGRFAVLDWFEGRSFKELDNPNEAWNKMRNEIHGHLVACGLEDEADQ
jgi:hypothetical protein